MSDSHLRSHLLSHLRAFGGLHWEETETRTPIGSPRRKPLAVLAVLAVAGPEGIDRDALASLLWSDLDDARARRALAQTLYALGREFPGDDLVIGGPQLRLNLTRVSSDVADLESLLAIASTASSLENTNAIIACYRGPFLDGVHFPGCAAFDQWVEAVRARYERRCVAVVHATADGLDDASLALPLLEAALQRIPHSTQLAVLFARRLSREGRVSEALAVLAEHSAAVRQLHDDEPAAEVARAIAEIRAGREDTILAPVNSASVRSPAAAPALAGASSAPIHSRTSRVRRVWPLLTVCATAIVAIAVFARRERPQPLDASARVRTEFQRLRDSGAYVDVDENRVGRVIIFSPSELTGRADMAALAPQILSELYRELGQDIPDLVDRRTVLALEREADKLTPLRPTTAERYLSMMKAADAALGVRVTYQPQGDSVKMFLETYVQMDRWRMRKRPASEDGIQRAERYGVGPALSTLSGPYGVATLRSFPFVNHVSAQELRRSLATMTSCSIDDHIAKDGMGMCWVARNRIFSFWSEMFDRRFPERFSAAGRPGRDWLTRLARASQDPSAPRAR